MKGDLALLYDFAITHDVLLNLEDDSRYHLAINLLKRMNENGLVADLGEGEWLQEFYKIYSSRRENQYRVHQILMHIIKLKDSNRLYPRQPIRDMNETWESCIARSHNENPFYAIVATKNLQLFEEYLKDLLVDLSPNNDTFELLEKAAGKRTVKITKTTRDFRVALNPLLKYASSAMIIDPYANCEDRYINSIALFLDLIGRKKTHPTLCKLEIHTGDPRISRLGKVSVHDRLSQWKEKLQPLVNMSGHIVYIYLREMKLGNKKFHNRYIITEQYGVQVPHGIDCFEGDGPDDEWTLLDKDVSDSIQRDFETNEKFKKILPYPLIVSPEN